MRTVTQEPDEQSRLQAFLKDVDPALLESLKRDERRRRRKLFLFTITGGLIMGSIIATLAILLLAPNTQPSISAKQADQALALSSEAWQLWQSGKVGQSAEKFEQSLMLDPNNANALNGLGWARLNGGEVTGAREAFEKCLAVQKGHPAALNGLGQIAYAGGDLAAAEKDFLAAAPNAPAAQVGLARLYLVEGKYDDALKYAEAAAAAPGADSMVSQLVAAAKARELDPQLKAMIEPPVSRVSEDGMRAWAMLNQGQLNQAKELFEAVLAKNQDDANAHNGLGFALVNLGKHQQAKPHFEQCLKLQPDAAGALNGLAICLKAEGNTDEAIKTWEKMVNRAPTPNAATAGLAVTYFERKEFAKAAPLLEQLVKADPIVPQYKEMLEKARAQAKDK